jgi:hypothetical protein
LRAVSLDSSSPKTSWSRRFHDGGTVGWCACTTSGSIDMETVKLAEARGSRKTFVESKQGAGFGSRKAPEESKVRVVVEAN